MSTTQLKTGIIRFNQIEITISKHRNTNDTLINWLLNI